MQILHWLSSGVAQPTATPVNLDDAKSILEATHAPVGTGRANEVLKLCRDALGNKAGAHMDVPKEVLNWPAYLASHSDYSRIFSQTASALGFLPVS